jgi:hypothetical protein
MGKRQELFLFSKMSRLAVYSLQYNGYRGFNPGVKRQGHDVATHVHPVPRLGMNTAAPVPHV